MRKRVAQILLALALAVLTALGDFPGAAAGAASLLSAGNPAWEVSGQTQGVVLSAKRNKKKKKKNTPSPAPGETATPAPQGAGREKQNPAEQDSGKAEKQTAPTPVPQGPIIDPQSIADWLFSHNMRLPDNFMTKREAQMLGWDSRYSYVSDVAPGMSIGGDYFGNYQGILPEEKGVVYREADCYYIGGRRKDRRIVYSSAGRVWYTGDHYNTFTELFPGGQFHGK